MLTSLRMSPFRVLLWLRCRPTGGRTALAVRPARSSQSANAKPSSPGSFASTRAALSVASHRKAAISSSCSSPGEALAYLPVLPTPVSVRDTGSPAAVFPLAYHHLRLGRSLPTPRCLHLQEPVLIAHHPVVADHPFRLQPENLIQFFRLRRRTMVVLLGCGIAPKPLIILRQILLLQKVVGGCIGFDLFPTQLLHQPVLVRAVIALHAPFRLCRVGRDDSSP